MNIVPIVKTVAGLASSLGAGAVVGNAIKATTPTEMKKITKVFVTIGGIALSGAAGDIAAKYVENEIQTLADSFKSARVAGAAAKTAAADAMAAAQKHADRAAEDVKDILSDAYEAEEAKADKGPKEGDIRYS